MMYRLLDWLSFKWAEFQMWLDSWKPCPKEEQGYRCRHQILSNGELECGKERNYWGGGDE